MHRGFLNFQHCYNDDLTAIIIIHYFMFLIRKGDFHKDVLPFVYRMIHPAARPINSQLLNSNISPFSFRELHESGLWANKPLQIIVEQLIKLVPKLEKHFKKVSFSRIIKLKILGLFSTQRFILIRILFCFRTK